MSANLGSLDLMLTVCVEVLLLAIGYQAHTSSEWEAKVYKGFLTFAWLTFFRLLTPKAWGFRLDMTYGLLFDHMFLVQRL